MADFNEIKKAFYELVESYADAPESSETKSKIADFAKLLPGDKEEQHNTLKNLDAAVRADVRIPGKIKLPAAVKKNIGTLLSGLQKHMTAKQPDKPAQNDDKPKKQPEKKNDAPALDDKGKKIILESLASVVTQLIEDAEKKNKPDSIADLQWNLPEDRANDKDSVRQAKEKRRQKQAQDMRKAFEIPEEISDSQIIETCREAVKEYTLKKLLEQQKSLLTKDNFAEIEQQIWQAQKNAKDKEKRSQSNDFVKAVRKKFKEEFGYDLMGRNGSVLRTMREAVVAFKKENHIEKNNDSERKPRPEKKDHKKEGGPDMAEDKVITDEMKEKLKKLGLSDEEIGALSYDAAAEKLKTNEGGDDKPKGDDKPRGDDEPKEGDDKDKSKDAPEEESTPKDPTAPLGVTEKPGEEREEHTDEKAPWVIRKQKWFDENIKPSNEDYKVTRADTEFEVQFAQGSIHYESETNAVVSKDASYKVYEALLKDPDNAQRPVKFPENASEHLTNMLYAASILNETPDGKPHEMQGLDKSKLNMEAIEKALKEAGYGDAEFKKVKAYYDTHEGKPATEDERGHDDHGVELSDVVKGIKAEDFERSTGTNSMKFSPNGVYNLESGEVRIDAVDKDPKVVYYSGTAPTDLPADVKAEPLKDEEVNHIKEQAKPAIETEVRRITKDQARMKELTDSGLIDIQYLESGELAICSKCPEVDTAKKAIDEYRALNDKQPQDKAFVAQVMANAPDVILKIHGDENTPQPQKDILQEKADSAKNVKDLLKERAALIDKDEKDLTPKDRLALTKNYIALLEEYKKDPSLVEVAMAEDLKQNNNSAERAKVHEDVKSKDKRSDFEEYHQTMEDYSKQAHDAVAAGGKLTIQDYMKKKYSTLSPEELDKRTKNQIQYNNAYQQYRSQKSTNTH